MATIVPALEHTHLLMIAGGLAVHASTARYPLVLAMQEPRDGAGARASFPAFDLEGNAGGVLPPPVTTAAKLGDVARLSNQRRLHRASALPCAQSRMVCTADPPQ